MMPVADIIREQDDLAAHTWPFVLWPRKWQDCPNSGGLDWHIHKLVQTERPSIPAQPGVYSLLVQPNIAGHPSCSYLMYVGKTGSLRRRFGDYLTRERRMTGRPMILRVLSKYPDNIWFCFTPVPSESLAHIEDALLTAYLPPCNDQYPAEISKVVGAF